MRCAVTRSRCGSRFGPGRSARAAVHAVARRRSSTCSVIASQVYGCRKAGSGGTLGVARRRAARSWPPRCPRDRRARPGPHARTRRAGRACPRGERARGWASRWRCTRRSSRRCTGNRCRRLAGAGSRRARPLYARSPSPRPARRGERARPSVPRPDDRRPPATPRRYRPGSRPARTGLALDLRPSLLQAPEGEEKEPRASVQGLVGGPGVPSPLLDAAAEPAAPGPPAPWFVLGGQGVHPPDVGQNDPAGTQGRSGRHVLGPDFPWVEAVGDGGDAFRREVRRVLESCRRAAGVFMMTCAARPSARRCRRRSHM